MNKENVLNFFKNDRYAKLTGIDVVDFEEGYCKAKLEIEEKHLNAANTIQGGAIFTLADYAFAIASNSRGQLSLAINVNISFLKGKSKGTLYAEAKELADPKRLGNYQVTVTDEKGELIALFNGIVYRKSEVLNF